MSVRIEQASWFPGFGWWVSLILLLCAGLLVNWPLAVGVLVVLLAQRARPLDPLLGFLLVTVWATFIRYEAGRLTFELSLFSVAILFMLFSYLINSGNRAFILSKTALLPPLLAYEGLSLVNYVRGLYSGFSLKYATIELLPTLALATSLLVANAIRPKHDLRLATWTLLLMAFGSASLGFYMFVAYGVRTGGIWFMPVPGVIAMLPVNLALRARKPLAAVGWSMLALPLFLHQFVSFTRGLWLGCIAGLLASLLIHSRWGEEKVPRARWRRIGLVFGTIAGAGILGAVILSIALGRTEFLSLAGSRFGSITATEFSKESASNVTRLAEYADVIDHIAKAPWFGHGVGFTFLHKEVIGFQVWEQWYVHHSYLFVWLKQGLPGLVIFVWMLWAASTFFMREAGRNPVAWESAWLATAAAATIFLATLGLSNFHLQEVNATFPLAFLWGVAMAIAQKGFIHFRWTDDRLPRGRIR